MKKILSAIISVCIFAGVLSSCTDGGDEAKKTVLGYWQSVESGNLDGLSAFFADGAKDKADMPIRYLDDYTEGILASLSGIIEEEKLNSVAENGIKTLLKGVDYNAEVVESTSENAVVRCTAAMPNLDVDIGSGMDMLLKAADVENGQELLKKFLDSKGLTLENVMEFYGDSKDAMEKDFVKWVIESYLDDFMSRLAADVKKTAKSWDFTVEEKNGRWLISDIVQN